MMVTRTCTGTTIAVSLKKRFDISLRTVANAILAGSLGNYFNISIALIGRAHNYLVSSK